MADDRRMLDGVIAVLMKATGPDRSLDKRIALATGWKYDRNYGPVGAWRAPNDEGWFGDWFSEGDDWPGDFTKSFDSAVLLVPKGWFWQVGRTSSFPAWANVYATHPDHGEQGKNEFNWHGEYWQQPIQTPVIALCIAALEARRSLIRLTRPI